MTVYPAVAVTGHRDMTDEAHVWLRPELDRINLRLADEFGTTDAATGMARGSDLEFGWSAVLAQFRLHAHIPYLRQRYDRGWTDDDRYSYERLLARCATQRTYGQDRNRKWFFVRNDGLLAFAHQHTGVLVAVWDGRRNGGTFDTVRKAARQRLPVIHVDPGRQVVHGPGCSCIVALSSCPAWLAGHAGH